MLILTRRIGETINIDSDINVVVLDQKGYQVSLGIQAPKDVLILRSELCEDQRQKENIFSQALPNRKRAILRLRR